MDLQAFRGVNVADVYKAGVMAGTLTRTGVAVSFSYTSDYSGAPVAHTLPLGTSVTGQGGAARFLLSLPVSCPKGTVFLSWHAARRRPWTTN